MSNNTALIKALFDGTIEVAPGRFAYRGSSQWFIFGSADVVKTPNGPRVKNHVPMPPWWSPEKQFVWRNKQTGVNVGEFSAYGEPFDERITADLTTGEEVKA